MLAATMIKKPQFRTLKSEMGLQVVVGCRVCGEMVENIHSEYDFLKQAVKVTAKCHGEEHEIWVTKQLITERYGDGLPVILEIGDKKEMMGVLKVVDQKKVEKWIAPLNGNKRMITLGDE